MAEILAAILDPVQVLSVLLKALASGMALLVCGTVLQIFLLAGLDSRERLVLARAVLWIALLAALAAGLRVPVRAVFLMGGMPEGAVDPQMLSLVIDSPLGASVLVRLAGLLLLAVIVLPGRFFRAASLVGAGLVAASFALRGHAANMDSLIPALEVSVHAAAAAYWIGAFWPLIRATRGDALTAGRISQGFGRRAGLGVLVLVVLGTLMALRIVGGVEPLVTSPYGRLLMLKLALVAGMLCLALANREFWTRRLLAGDPHARRGLRLFITVESILAALVFLVTALFTTVTPPPA